MWRWAAAIGTTTGIIGASLTLWMAVPQAWSIWRDRTARGVSYATWFLFCLSFSLWIGYSTRVGNEVVLVSNIASLSTASALVVGLTRVTERGQALHRWTLIGFATACVAIATVGRFGPLDLVGVLLVSAVFVRGPQVVRSVRTYRAAADSEVSRASWWMSLVGGACWVIHGALRPDGNIVVASSGVVALSAAVLAFEYAGERARRSTQKVQ